jgi:hypothetical protein
MREIKLVILVLLLAAPAIAQNVSVSDGMSIITNAGEAQSTVVPPKKNPKCEQGRFLVTNDRRRPPSGVVMGRNLDQTTGTPIVSKFEMGTLASNYDRNDLANSKYSFGTNDHDLMTLSNGDVLYITGAFSRMPFGPPGSRPLQIWMSSLFKDTFRTGACAKFNANDSCIDSSLNFGPNTRSVLLVWRSTDCGENFSFVAEMDPVRFGGATCALPQFRIKSPCAKGEDCRILNSPWDMGGTDGQLARVNLKNDMVYTTFQCVGYTADDIKKTNPLLDSTKKLNKTMVLSLDPAQAKWQFLGYIEQAAWRFSHVNFGGNLLFAAGASVLTGNKNNKGNYVFDSKGTPAPIGSWAWMGEWNFKDSQDKTNIPIELIGSNVLAVPVISRTPDANTFMLAFPDNFGSKGWGYRVAFYDRVSGKVTDASDTDSILPDKANADNVVFHLAVADPGTGPVLLYWTDLESSTKKVTVRGRLITGKAKFSDPFVISRTNGADASFTLSGNEYWYGDYHTAGAYVRKFPQKVGQGRFQVEVANTTRYDYYPMWVEAGSVLRYAKVEHAVTTEFFTLAPATKTMKIIERQVPLSRWRPGPFPVELSRIRRQTRPTTREPDVRERMVLPAPPLPRP